MKEVKVVLIGSTAGVPAHVLAAAAEVERLRTAPRDLNEALQGVAYDELHRDIARRIARLQEQEARKAQKRDAQ